MLEALACLATAIYFEARGEPTVGQIAVGQVIMSRVADYRYPSTVCEVVKEGYYYSWNTDIPIPNQCQFSFYCDGKPETIQDKEAYLWAEEIASGLLYGELNYIDLTEGSTHYHASYVSPRWRKDIGMQLVGRIGAHIFYRWE